MRRRWNFARIVGHRRDHRRADAVHDEVGVALEQRHQRGDAVEDLALRRGLHGLDERAAAVRRVRVEAVADRAVRRRGRRPCSRSASAAGVDVGRLDEGPDLVHHVPAQPRHRTELHPVGLLVQAHPEPEVARVDAHLPLGRDDVRARPAAAGRAASSGSAPYGGNSSYWPSTLVARNASSEPVCTPVTFEPTASTDRRGRRPLLLELLDQRLEDGAEAGGVGVDPARPVDDRRPRQPVGSAGRRAR